MNVEKSRIKITGTPIIQKTLLQDKHKTLTKYGLNHKKKVILAINPIKLDYNLMLMKLFSEIKENVNNSDFDFLIKLHPSQNYKQYKWIEDRFKIDILPINISFKELVSITEILLTHNSGLANEVLYNRIKVGILDILPIPSGNGEELYKYLNVPFVRSVEDFQFIHSLPFNDIFNKTDLFYKYIGEEANKCIRNNIKHLMSL